MPVLSSFSTQKTIVISGTFASTRRVVCAREVVAVVIATGI